MCCGLIVRVPATHRFSGETHARLREATTELWGPHVEGPADTPRWSRPYRVVAGHDAYVYMRDESDPSRGHGGHTADPLQWLRAFKLALGLYWHLKRAGQPVELIQLGGPCQIRTLATESEDEPDMHRACTAALHQEHPEEETP